MMTSFPYFSQFSPPFTILKMLIICYADMPEEKQAEMNKAFLYTPPLQKHSNQHFQNWPRKEGD